MKKTYNFLSVLAVIVTFSACASNENDYSDVEGGQVEHIRFCVKDFEWAEGEGDVPARHRTQAERNGSGVNFIWSATDTVGIYSTKGSQMEFPINTGAGEAYADFDGGCWALKNDYTYIAYYPFNKYNLDRSNIPFVYGTPQQVGNDNIDNLTQFDYIVSQQVRPTNGEVSFQFHHLGALVKFVFTVPEADSFTSFSLVGPSEIFPYRLRLNLSDVLPEYTVVEKSKAFNMKLSDINVGAGGTVTLWALMPYADLSARNLTAMLYGTGGKCYTATLAGKNLESGKAYQYKATLKAQANAHEWVDLGLPSGIKWATCNVGAAAPEKYGTLFAWGETLPHESGEYSWTSYMLCGGTNATMTKYNNNVSYGVVDNKSVLDKEDDAATANWGFPWRMPTYEDFDELRRCCTWTWTTKNGVYGRKATGPNGKYIFLPAAGYRNLESLNFAGSYGYYWTSSLNTENPSQTHVFYFHSSYFGWGTYNRYNGRSVRAVCD